MSFSFKSTPWFLDPTHIVHMQALFKWVYWKPAGNAIIARVANKQSQGWGNDRKHMYEIWTKSELDIWWTKVFLTILTTCFPICNNITCLSDTFTAYWTGRILYWRGEGGGEGGSGWTTVWVSQYLSAWASEYLNIWIPEYLGTWQSKYLSIWIPFYLITWASNSCGNQRLSAHLRILEEPKQKPIILIQKQQEKPECCHPMSRLSDCLTVWLYSVHRKELTINQLIILYEFSGNPELLISQLNNNNVRF